MPHQIALVLLAVSAIGASVTQPSAGRARRIVGGELAVSTQIPYLVNIRKNGVFLCGGSLVTARCVLTAAHCVRGGAPQDFVVRAGATFLTDLQNGRPIDRIFTPVEYSNKTFEHDIAVFRLKAAIVADSGIRPIRIADFVPEQGELVRVSGWGFTHENATHPPNQMRTVRVRVMQHEKCQALYADYRNVSKTMFCASVPGYKDACMADSGGPAVSRGQLVGVVSWGKGHDCGRAESPGVYASLRPMRRWIIDTLYRHCR